MISARFEEALELARRAHALSEGANPHQRMHATWPIIAALYHLGRWGEALPVVDEHTEAFRQDPAPGCSFVRDGPIIGAAILTHRGELGRARALAALVGPPTNLATASAWQARLATASGDPATAVGISEDKARERRLYGQQHLVALLASLAAPEARALLEAALATYEELACPPRERAVRDRLRELS